MIRRVHSFSR